MSKRLLIGAALIALLTGSAEPAAADQIVRYRSVVIFHRVTPHWFWPRGSATSETVMYDGSSEADKAAQRIDWCKKYQCAKEIPLPQ